MMAMAEKNLVPNEEEFECPICYVPIDVGQGVKLRECLHHCCKYVLPCCYRPIISVMTTFLYLNITCDWLLATVNEGLCNVYVSHAKCTVCVGIAFMITLWHPMMLMCSVLVMKNLLVEDQSLNWK